MVQVTELLESFLEDLEKLMGQKIDKVILYGSYARGENRENSDIDLMILTSIKQDDIPNIEDRVYDLAFDFEMEKGIMLSVNIVNTEHFNCWLLIMIL